MEIQGLNELKRLLTEVLQDTRLRYCMNKGCKFSEALQCRFKRIRIGADGKCQDYAFKD